MVRHHAVTVPATTANLGPGFDAFGLALTSYGDGSVTSLVVRSVPRSSQAERVVTAGEGADEVTTGDDNLVWRSLVAFCEANDASVPDVAVRARNHVPLERGLGSSSAAIVAGLVLGRALTQVAIGDRDLVALASTLEGHPDNVAPALLGGLVACATDAHGGLVVRRINPAPSLRPVVLVPTTRQATGGARAVLPESLPRNDVATQAARAAHVLAGVAGLWPTDPGLVGDVLHEPPRLAAMPGSGAAVAALRAGGAHAWLSGAGPSVATFAGREADAALTADVAARHGFVVHPLAVDLAGAVACPDDGCGISGGGGCARCPRQRV